MCGPSSEDDWTIPPKLWPYLAALVACALVVLWNFLRDFNPTP